MLLQAALRIRVLFPSRDMPNLPHPFPARGDLGPADTLSPSLLDHLDHPGHPHTLAACDACPRCQQLTTALSDLADDFARQLSPTGF